ncbi:hypothetical protein C8J56DRAFT_933181 [Mycena floridula]|nr:hypothetical protein C8J56DRAFT_933181 [Mycena floridula]
MSISLLGFPEELVNRIVVFLLDDSDYQCYSYPASLYHHVSSDISMLSLVNHQFRRICFPFLFSYIECKDLEELSKLERECLSDSAFTGFVRILHVATYGPPAGNDTITEESLLRLLPRLKSLVWLDLGYTELSATLVPAIEEHPTLRTAAIRMRDLPVLPQSPAKLEKLLLHSLSPYWYGARANGDEFSIVQRRNISVICLSVFTNCIPAVETKIPNLRCLNIDESLNTTTEQHLEQIHALVAAHPSLTEITVCTSLLGCNFFQPRLSSFLKGIEPYSLGERICFTLSPIELSSDKKGLDGWEVTRLDLEVTPSLQASLPLVSTMFPNLVSLDLSFCSPIHVDSFLVLMSKHLRNLQMLDLHPQPESLIWTPLLIPLLRELSDKPCADFASRLAWFAWQIFLASPSVTHFDIEFSSWDNSLRPPPWYISGSYQVKRDWFGAIVGMKLVSSVMEKKSGEQTRFSGFVVL